MYANIENGTIRFATVVENGGVGAAVIKSALGNGVGVCFEMTANELYSEGYGDLIVSLEKEGVLDGIFAKRIIHSASPSTSFPSHVPASRL